MEKTHTSDNPKLVFTESILIDFLGGTFLIFQAQ